MNIFVKRSIEFGKMLYKQGRYKEAEVVIKDNLVSAETKFLMGKICMYTNRMEEAKNWFTQSIDSNYRWILPRMELARILTKQGLYQEAAKEYKTCLNREPKNAFLKLEVAQLYVLMEKNIKAEELAEKALRLQPNDNNILKKALEVYDGMYDYDKMYDICEKLTSINEIEPTEHKTIELMAKTYFALGKYDKTLQIFSGKTGNNMTRIMANLFKRKIYCALSKDEEQAKMYQTILDNLETSYGEEGRLKHIEKHLRDDMNKEKHGVFIKDLDEVIETVKKAEKVKQQGKECDVYCIKLEGCGYEGGNKGDGHILDYVTLVTMPDTYKTITLFPSDKIELKDLKREENKVKVVQNEGYER